MASSGDALTVEREDLNPATVRLSITCGDEIVNTGFRRALKKIGKEVRIPGFRKGSAPAHVIEKAVDPQELYGRAADIIINDALKKAVAQEELEMHGRAMVDVEKFEREPAECIFSAKVPLEPVVEIGDVASLTYTAPPTEVTDEEIDHQLDELRKAQGKHEQITDRGVSEGDVCVVKFTPEDKSIDSRSFMIVAGQTFAELDKELSGMKAEEIKSVDLTFPDNFQEKDWAGKQIKATLTIRSVSAVRAPDLDEDFAKSMDADSVDDLRDRVKVAIERAKERMSEEDIYEQLISQLMEKSQVVVPDTTWESVAERRIADIEESLKSSEKGLEDYAKDQNMTLDEFKERVTNEAKLHVERATVIEKIFREQEMKITDDEANRHFLQIAQENDIPQDKLQTWAENVGSALREEILYRSMQCMVMEHLKEQASAS